MPARFGRFWFQDKVGDEEVGCERFDPFATIRENGSAASFGAELLLGPGDCASRATNDVRNCVPTSVSNAAYGPPTAAPRMVTMPIGF